MYILAFMRTLKAQLVKWGNSNAVRIPRVVLERVKLEEGDDLQIEVEGDRIIIGPLKSKLTLDSLVAGITVKNTHSEQNWGKPRGREVW